jgi:peptidoglycan DL-endopeptidase CwlO
MSQRLLALTTSLVLAAPLAALPTFAQQQPAPAAAAPATPAPGQVAPATQAPATQAPAAVAPAPGSAAPTEAAPAPHRAMGQRGSRSERIERLQNALNQHGASLTVDGKMGPQTRAALEDFQKSHNLKVTGRPNRETIAALRSSS